MPLTKNSITGISLDSAGLIALADLSTISERTALIGTSWYIDMLFLAPGIHTQQKASEVNKGELPAAAAMHSGYVFRIENQAMVFYLQRIGEPGHLADVRVKPVRPSDRIPPRHWVALLLYTTGVAMTITCFVVLGWMEDYWAVGVLGMLVLARALNVVVFRRRAVPGWKGQKEPGVQGDLLVLLSQDRWVRLRGTVDDIKLVTSGQWVRELDPMESVATGVATLLVYCAAALAANTATVGALFIAVLLLLSVALLALCNALTTDMNMFGCRVYVSGPAKAYRRRVHMAEDMIKEHGNRRDWAIGMGLVLPDTSANLETNVTKNM